MNEKDTRGRKMRSDNVRVVPEFCEQIDIEKFCQALIEIAKSMAEDNHPDRNEIENTNTSDET